jgi:hypothetical protein
MEMAKPYTKRQIPDQIAAPIDNNELSFSDDLWCKLVRHLYVIAPWHLRRWRTMFAKPPAALRVSS